MLVITHKEKGISLDKYFKNIPNQFNQFNFTNCW